MTEPLDAGLPVSSLRVATRESENWLRRRTFAAPVEENADSMLMWKGSVIWGIPV